MIEESKPMPGKPKPLSQIWSGPRTLVTLKRLGYNGFDKHLSGAELRSRCRSCRCTILWVVTPNGIRMPIEPRGVNGDGVLTYDSHFAHCPEAAKHRRRR